ncbi:ribosome biogenesis GTPase Der [Tepidiphilus thermophilus]|uniref:GTPase Der n=1 Tax=Tepidiphilus thermophilus TaxID=876478 RepID=A0A0K6IXQ2_9PROT|nr:ribosome biogenesis GTPase Der [Tepidiphilus thermophilus]CUB08082.1 ribosome-associated GTPase EngA [Tepidiphilus thermophilus]
MAALPTVVLVGRPNVGKSTLFNRLTQSRDALVADVPGLTRDRRYGQGRLGPRPYLVVDTAGFDPTSKEGITREMARQAEQAIREADVVLFLVDGRAGLTAHDRDIADYLRRLGRPVRLVVNKTEGMRQVMATAEFHALGLGEPMAISAAHGEGVRQMIAEVLADFPEDEEVAPPQDEDVPRVAVVGRPNVGKSTLINALLGEERLIAYDQPGTTRDAIEVPFVQGTRRYVLVDTAGVRRKGRVTEAVEKFSVIKTMQAVERANVAVLVLDATQEIADQDAHLGGFILEAGRALVVAVNKWDAVDDYRRSLVKTQLASKLGFLSFARTVFLSAAKGQGLAPLLKAVDEAYAAAFAKLPTPQLTRVLQELVKRQAPPRHGLFRPKPRYAHQGGGNPPVIVIHGNALEHLSKSYRRYLEHGFLEAFRLRGTPLKFEWRTSENPYVKRSD